MTIPQVCKRLGVSEQTFYRWRTKYGALKEDEAHRLKALEQENSRLKRIVAEQALDISMLKDLQRGNSEPGSPPGCRSCICSAVIGSRSVVRAGWSGRAGRRSGT